MTDSTAKPAGSENLKPFKKGFDSRRWMGGRGKKSPEQREGERILRAVIWEELSRDFDVATMRPLESSETIDAMRLMVRGWIKKHPNEVAERIAGKVAQSVDVTSGGEKITQNPYASMTDAELLAQLEKIINANKSAD